MTQVKPPSLKDVARAAAVSTATVSRALSHPTTVRPTTRAVVLRAVRQLGYTPNLHARGLAERHSRTIGVIVSNLENPFFLDVFGSLEREARRHGYEVLVAHTGYDPDRLRASVHLMVGRRVSGVAAIASEITPPLVAALAKRQIPVVLYDAGTPMRRGQAVHIRVDYTAVMRQLVEMLYDLGHRRFAFVGHHTSLAPLNARLQAFLDVVGQHGQGVQHAVMAETDSLEGGRAATRTLLARAPVPTAIVCVNDFMAIGVLRELHERKLRVPHDVSVTGFDNIALAECVTPSLTTADIPRAEIGRLAMAGLMPTRDAEGQTCEVVLTPQLIIRESTARARRTAAR